MAWNDACVFISTFVFRALVFIVHGYCEHCLFYNEIAELLMKEGFYVFAHDHGNFFLKLLFYLLIN